MFESDIIAERLKALEGPPMLRRPCWSDLVTQLSVARELRSSMLRKDAALLGQGRFGSLDRTPAQHGYHFGNADTLNVHGIDERARSVLIDEAQRTSDRETR